jgi:hypothetical protein
MSVATFAIQGRTVTLPVEVRRASSWAAVYAVPADAAQRIVEPTGLRVIRTVGGRALVTLVVARYEDGDLDAYNELGVSFLVHPHEGATRWDLLRNRGCVYIHHLPVNESFTLQAGREIWGYPKYLADIEIDEGEDETTTTMSVGERFAISLTVRDPGPMRAPRQTPATYTFLDGVLRRTEWETRGPRALVSGSGAAVALGEGAIAEELRSLGLPKKALFTLAQRDFRARFGAAEVVRA